MNLERALSKKRREMLPMYRFSLMTVLMTLAAFASPMLGRADDSKDVILVIANKAVPETSLSRDELRPLFQSKMSSLPSGTEARVFNLPEADSARRGFDAATLGLDPERVTRYWIDRKIRGGDRPPQTVPSGAVMVKLVGKTPGAIGYVDSKVALDANVKVVARVINGQLVKP
jgi:ABC-type phosphate transport system substrate-binding protein